MFQVANCCLHFRPLEALFSGTFHSCKIPFIKVIFNSVGAVPMEAGGGIASCLIEVLRTELYMSKVCSQTSQLHGPPTYNLKPIIGTDVFF